MLKSLFSRWFYGRRDRLAKSCNLLAQKFLVIPPDILPRIPPCRGALVIAPHSDDEVIGSGGVIQQLLRQGSGVEVLIVTGRSPTGQENTASVRRAEAAAAANILGVTRLAFLDFEDGNAGPPSRLEEELRQRIETARPEIVFAPNIFDNHPDHIAIGRAVARLAARCAVDFQCYFFEVWTPLTANVVIDITGEMETKIKAMQAHRSQTESTDFVEMIRGINKYRAIAALSGNPGMQYAEAFFRVRKGDWSKLRDHL